MSAAKSGRRKEKSSPDYSHLARGIAEASRDDATSKLPSGLYIVATPIGNLGDISLRALWTLSHADRIACEDTRLSGALLAHYGIKKPLLPYHDHNADKARPEIMRKLEDGESIALISDAGMPLIADPGFKLVRECRASGIGVTVIPGANAALAALAGSGLPTDHFHFAGFLPPKSAARRKAIEELAAIPSTLVLFEAPQRLADALKDLADILDATRPAAVARELTKMFEESRLATLGELATHYLEHAAKGEIVIVIGPPQKEAAAPDASTIDKALRDALRTLSLRDAVTAVSGATGVKKNEVYARALRLKGKT
jgi:16S rRNA (cytidine1402-2'-O)-methyltransferase